MKIIEKKPSKIYDTAWKTILDHFFKDFLDLCLPQVSQLINWDIPWQSLDKELLALTKDSLTGSRLVDKLMKVFLKTGKEQWILIHVDVQGEAEDLFPQRMFTYNFRLYDKHSKPLVGCAILTDADPDWRPNHYQVSVVPGSCLRVDFLNIKLIDYEAKLKELEASTNPFASVILIQLESLRAKRKSNETRFQVKYRLTKRLYEKGFSKEEIKNLYLFIDWVICLPREMEDEYLKTIYQLEVEKEMEYISYAERRGIEQGVLQGKAEGLAEGLAEGKAEGLAEGKAEGLAEGKAEGKIEGLKLVVARQLQLKFGDLPNHIRQQIENADSPQLLIWTERILGAKALNDIFE